MIRPLPGKHAKPSAILETARTVGDDGSAIVPGTIARSMRLFPQLRRLAIYALPLAFLLTAATARIVAPDLLGRLSLIAFDFYQRMAPRAATNSPVAIVDVDDKSLAAIGQWPWPRTIIAQLVEKLAKAGAVVVAFDIDFAEPDRTSPKLLLPLLLHNGAGAQQAGELLGALPDPDAQFARAMRAIPVVTGFILSDQIGRAHV